MADALRIPVIASGAIMDGRGVMAALSLGGAGAQMGTAFLASSEASSSDEYREALLKAADADSDVTEISTTGSGYPARGIRTPGFVGANQIRFLAGQGVSMLDPHVPAGRLIVRTHEQVKNIMQDMDYGASRVFEI